MTAVLDRGTPAAPAGSPGTGFRLPALPRQRRPLLVAVSALAVFASIAAFAGVYASANRRTAVLVVTRTIQQGQPITGKDLGSARAAIAGGVSLIPVAEAPSLAGRRAAVTIPAGSLLTSGDVTGSRPIASGDAVVGLALKAGQLPSSGLTVGDQVMIVQTASPGTPLAVATTGGGSSTGPSATAGILVPEAEVFEVAVPPAASTDSSSQLVSVEVSTSLAATVSAAAAADQVSLVLLPDGGSAAGGTGPPATHGTARLGGAS